MPLCRLPRWVGALLAVGLPLVGSTGCGAGGTSAGAEQISLVAFSVAAEDGVVFNDHTLRTDGVLPQTGDIGQPGSSIIGRQFFSFDLSAVPAGAIVESAVLRLDAFVVVGAPYTSLGTVVVDHLDYGALDETDFAARALESGLGPLATDATLGPKTVDVSAAVAGDVARGRNRAQFRVRFTPLESDGDTSNDFVSFAEAEAASSGSGQQPTLSLVVRVPN